MLKVQLRSKINVLANWQDVEDVLTGDFFGALDYLPREPFLRDFLDWVAAFNTESKHPQRDSIPWDEVEFIFWPRIASLNVNESAEPDIVIVSNRWVIVVEIKLDSCLGYDQPWREYCAGRDLARDRGLCDDDVYYLLVTRRRQDIASTFAKQHDPVRMGMLARTTQLFWFQCMALVERWIKNGAGNQPLRSDQRRMLTDLHAALRRRRTLSFAGFAFINQEPVADSTTRFFCPDMFEGFQRSSQLVLASDRIFLNIEFEWLRGIQARAVAPASALLSIARFEGFLNGAPNCRAERAFKFRE